MKIKQNKIGAYLTLSAGVGCVGAVNGQTVTFFDQGVNTVRTVYIGVGNSYGFGYIFTFPSFTLPNRYFTSSSINDFSGNESVGYNLLNSYFDNGSFINGARLGNLNFINISTGGEPVGNAVGQFFLDGQGGGHLVAIAENTNGSALSLVDGVAAIEAAAVPEPSSLVLLALGALGLTARRQRKKTA